MNTDKNPWPPHVGEWLASEMRQASDNEKKARIGRLTDDFRLKRVAARLGNLALQMYPDEDALGRFLEETIRLGDFAHHISEKGLDHFRDEIREVAEESERYLKVLARHERIAVYLSEGRSYAAGVQRLEDLRNTIKFLADKAAAGLDLSGLDYYIAPSRKNQEHTYFVRMLAKYSEQIFGDPLDAEVGVLAGVCFNIPELTPTEVRAIRERTIRVNGKSPTK